MAEVEQQFVSNSDDEDDSVRQKSDENSDAEE
jgi:hypothetical protein